MAVNLMDNNDCGSAGSVGSSGREKLSKQRGVCRTTSARRMMVSELADTPRNGLIHVGWGNDSAQETAQSNGQEVQNAEIATSGGGGGGMLDERMSEGTNLISNDFQVEVSFSALAPSESRAKLMGQVKLADLQADPNSPLYSIKTFEELPM